MPKLRYDITPKTDIGSKIEKLAESLPYKEWYLPDPYDPTSYIMPIGGITKEAFAKQITKLIGENPKTKSLAEILPRKILQKIRQIRSTETLPEVFRKKVLGAWWPGEKTLHLNPKAGLDVAAHEIGEVAGDLLSRGKTVPDQISQAVADYVGSSLGERVGLSRRPRVTAGRDLYNEALAELGKMKSENPWMNIYRYFKKITK